MNIQAQVALDKEKHPERFCKVPRCLWKVVQLDHGKQTYSPRPDCPEGFCPRHRGARMMLCSGCRLPIESHTKFLCVYLTPIGFNLAVGCTHFTPPQGWNLIFGGSECFHDWLTEFEIGLRACKHNGDRHESN